MQNDTIDLQNLKRIKIINPLFENCSKAIPLHNLDHESPGMSDIRKTINYLVLPGTVHIEEKVFQCKSLCPIFNSNGESFILIRGQNLWDFYRAKKDNQIIMTQEELWVFVKHITEALLHLQQFNHYHNHLKQQAIYRQSSFSYQLVYHPQMRSMRQLARLSDSFYWHDFYLSPEQLKADRLQTFKATAKQTVFSLGLLLLNVMNSEDFNRSVYSKIHYEVDWNIIRSKIDYARKKYSQRLISLVKNCLKQSPDQRYGLRQVLNDTFSSINISRNLHIQFKSKFDQLITSKIATSNKKKFHKNDDSGQNFSRKSSQSAKSTSKSREKQHLAQSRQKPVKNSKLSPQSEKKFSKTFQSPPKKSKTHLTAQKKPYSIAKAQIKEKQKKQEGLRKQPSSQNKEKIVKNFEATEDVINFERGTFGGQQSSEVSSFSSSKFKKEIAIEIKSYPNQSIKQQIQNEQIYSEQKIDNFETDRMITFGEMKLQKVINPSSSVDSLDSEIYILDSARKQQQQVQKEPKAQNQRQGLSFSKKPSENIPQAIIEQYQRPKAQTIQNIKECAKAFQGDRKLANLTLDLEREIQKLTINLIDCLQPLEILQNSVSQTHGVYIHGNIYFGAFKHGRRNGFGLQIFPQSQYYFGNFKDDLFHGQGFYYWNKNQYFLGFFENGKRAFGHLFGPKLHYIGQFVNSKKMNGFGKAKFKNGQEYIGQWVQGRKCGFGKLTQITKDYFIGFWQKGKRIGYGQHISSGYPQQGYRMKAFWKGQKIVSDVIIEHSDQSVYQGSLNQDLQKHGKGHFIFKNSGYFKGTFYKDNATHGELVYKNGQKYIGSLKNMKRHGFGQYHYLDGTIKKGNWTENIRIEKAVDMSTIK